MKKLLVYGTFILALAACKNDKTTTKTDDNATPSTSTGTDNTGTTPDNGNTTTGVAGKGWTDEERAEFLKVCVEGSTATMGQSKASDYCACMGKKMETAYPNSAEVGNMTEEKRTEMAADCLK